MYPIIPKHFKTVSCKGSEGSAEIRVLALFHFILIIMTLFSFRLFDLLQGPGGLILKTGENS